MIREYIVKIDSQVPLGKNELVRCKDCIYHGTYDCDITLLTTQITPDNNFCSGGKRKGD